MQRGNTLHILLRDGCEPMRKRIVNTILVCSVLVAVVMACATGRNAAAEGRRTVKLGGNKHLPPYEYLNEYDMFKGFNVDLMNALAIEANIDVELYPMSWSLAQICLDKGYLDGIQGMPRTQQAAAVYDFTDPFLTVQGRIVVRRETTHIVDLEDLRGRRVAVEKDSLGHHLLLRYQDIEIVLLNDQIEVIERLLSGEVDAAIAYDTTARYVAEKWRREDEIKIAGEPVFTAAYCIALKKGNGDLVDAFDRGLKSLKKTGMYDKIYEKWFGTPVDDRARMLKRYFPAVLGILGILALIAAGSIRWNYVLKREVSKRTAELKRINVELERQRCAILEKDAFKEQILDSVGNGIVTLDYEGRITSLNATAGAFLASDKTASQDSLLGEKWDNTLLSSMVDKAVLSDCIAAGRRLTGIDREIEAPGGRRRWFNVNVYPLVRVDGKVDGAIIVFADETEKKRLQEQVYRQNKLQALGQMVAGAAHEIRNPLSAIKSFTDLLPRKFGDPSFREEFLRHVPAEVARLDRIICDLLDFSKPRTPVAEVFPARLLVNSALTLLQKKIKSKRARISVEVGEETIYADPGQIKQALINVLSNAVEWIDEGGHIEIYSRVENGTTMLCVSDDGKGIAPDVLSDVFNPFFTLRPGGTGLGLTLSHQYVTDNGGVIEIESSPGRGTRVYIRVPSNPLLKERIEREEKGLNP